MSSETPMPGDGESHSGRVPMKQPNEGQGGPKEVVEGRPVTQETGEEPNAYRTQSGRSGRSGRGDQLFVAQGSHGGDRR